MPVRSQMAVYWREAGPVAYEVPAPKNRAEAAALVDGLLESPLTSLWESERDEPVAPAWRDRELPAARPLTHLRPTTAQALVDDLLEENDEGYRRHVTLLTVDPIAADNLQDSAYRRAALEAFCHREEGPLHLVRVQIGDQANHLVFAPHEPVPEARALLQRWWGIGVGGEPRRDDYERLRLVRLEVLAGLCEGSS